MKIWATHGLMALASVLAIGTNALSQEYPNKPVRIFVGYPPGGAPDLIARTVGQSLTKLMGQQFLVENRSGAGGTLAVDFVAKSAADGYTLLLGETGQLEIAPALRPALSYDTLRDLTPVGFVTTSGAVLATHSKSNIKTLQDLIREAKANPGRLNYGSSGVGSFHHIVFEALKASAGISLTHIPFGGAALVQGALRNGDIHVMLTNATDANRFNALATPTAQRYPFFPEVPTIAEETGKEFDFSADFGLLAPAKLPPGVLAKLSNGLKASIASPEVQAPLRKLQFAVMWTTPDEYAEKISRNLKKYEQVIREAKIKPE